MKKRKGAAAPIGRKGWVLAMLAMLGASACAWLRVAAVPLRALAASPPLLAGEAFLPMNLKKVHRKERD